MAATGVLPRVLRVWVTWACWWPPPSEPELELAALFAVCRCEFFLDFILLFWNQILIWRSVRLRFRASSHLRHGAIRHAAAAAGANTGWWSSSAFVCPISKIWKWLFTVIWSDIFAIKLFYCHCGIFCALLQWQLCQACYKITDHNEIYGSKSLHLIKNKRGKNSPSHGTDFTFSVWKRRR